MDRYKEFLQKQESRNQLRRIPEETSGVLDLVSNDYLGLARNSMSFQEEFFNEFTDLDFSSSASRLLSRKQKYHNMLERELSGLYEKSALLFNSGYHANTGIISALANKNVLFLVDRLMHASGWDGLMMAKEHRNAEMQIFPHNDIQCLEALIAKERESGSDREIFIITEGVFSMDGDVAPLTEIIEIKERYRNIKIYLDEAHSFGVKGKKGLGLAEELDLLPQIDIIIGTFGKAAASCGAFVATSEEIKNFLINRARSFIFSTALPPINIAWSYFMLSKIVDMKAERKHLYSLSKEFSSLLSVVPGQRQISNSQIIPFLCGSAQKAILAASKLQENGIDVLPIRHPSVPLGSERLRFSLNAQLSLSQLSSIPEILSNL